MTEPSSTNPHRLQLLYPFEGKSLAAASDVSGRVQTSSAVRRSQSLCEVNDRVPPSQTSLDASLTRLQGPQSSFQRWLEVPPETWSERWLAQQSSKPLQRWLAGLPQSISRRQLEETSRWLEEASHLWPLSVELAEVNPWISTTRTKLDKPLRRALASPRNPNERPPDMRYDPYTFGSIVKPPVALIRPQVLLFGKDILWIFTGVSLPQFLAKASVYGISITQLPPEDGVDESSRTSSSQLGQSLHEGHVDSGRIGKQKSTRTRFPNQRAQAIPKSGRKRSGRDDGVRFGCPFSKLNPHRYLQVRGRNRNPCTDPPGLEYGHIREHLREFHSAKVGCPYCGTKWNENQAKNFEEALYGHLDLNSGSDHGACVSSEQRLRKPECMTAVQEEALNKMTRMSADREKGWVELYKKLFPMANPIPSPYWDFFIPRCLVQMPADVLTPSVEANAFTVFTPRSQTQQDELNEFTQHNDDRDDSTLNLNANVSLTPEESSAELERQSTSQLLQVHGIRHEQTSARNTLGSEGGATAGPSSLSVPAPVTETLNQLNDCGNDLKTSKASDPSTTSTSTRDSGYCSAPRRPHDSWSSRFSDMPITPSMDPPVSNFRETLQNETNNGPRDSTDGCGAALYSTRVEDNGMTIVHFSEETPTDEMFNYWIQYG